MTRVLLACDKFKGSLTAREVVAALRAGLRAAAPDVDLVRVPVADGGDGTVLAALKTGFEPLAVTVSGPTGQPVETVVALERPRAVVELADVCGLVRLGGSLAPLDASTRGLGEALAAAIDAGVTDIVVGIGGSASTDGGAGMLQALGARLLDAAGRAIDPGVRGLERLESVDLAPALARVRDVRLTVACDVDNPLLGPRGAAAVFGPQKGLDGRDVPRADAALQHLAQHVSAALPELGVGGLLGVEAPGAGAAGGTGWALQTVLGATLTPGADLVLDLVGFDAALAGADLVITGEGSFDEQTLSGKAPLGVLRRAQAAGVPVRIVCGRNCVDGATLARLGLTGRVHALTDLEPDPAQCMTDAARLLTDVGRQIGAALIS